MRGAKAQRVPSQEAAAAGWSTLHLASGSTPHRPYANNITVTSVGARRSLDRPDRKHTSELQSL